VVSIPTSATLNLPIQLSRSKRVTIVMGATPEGDFNASINLDGIPHVRLIAHAKATVAKDDMPGKMSGGLTIQTTRTVCRAPTADAAKAKLKVAGEKLRDAILAIQKPPPAKEGEEEIIPAEAKRWGELGGAVAKVMSTIDELKTGCREVPLVSVDFGARGPLGRVLPGKEKEGERHVGATITLHF
jgi:hypothetical protein